MSVPSPCNDICRMHAPSGLCEGCGRTIDEIAAWGGLDEPGRARIVAQLPARMAALQRLLFPEPARSAAPGAPR
jgi:predicted Fe-S protein YdhL (DUF1289 family)